MTTRDILIALLVLIIVSFFFTRYVPLMFTGPLGFIVLVVLIIVLVRNT